MVKKATVEVCTIIALCLVIIGMGIYTKTLEAKIGEQEIKIRSMSDLIDRLEEDLSLERAINKNLIKELEMAKSPREALLESRADWPESPDAVEPISIEVEWWIEDVVGLLTEGNDDEEFDWIEFHEVEEGDWLSKLAEKYYGDMHAWGPIYLANSYQIDDPDLIYPGQVLIIPDPDTFGSEVKDHGRRNIEIDPLDFMVWSDS